MEFTFWRENKTDQEFKITLEQAKALFAQWIAAKWQEKGGDWVKHNTGQLHLLWVGEQDGLNSVAEDDTYIALEQNLRKYKWSVMEACGEGLGMFRFRSTLKHDEGKLRMITMNTSTAAAKKQVMDAELCPERSILEVEQMVDGNWVSIYKQ
jgi:hypothetical protein